MLSHINNLRFLTAFFVLSVLFVSGARAQHNDPPSGQFGLGIYVSAAPINAFGGIDAVYAINPNMQVGTGFSLRVSSPGTTLFGLSPYFRYQFSSKVSPFLEGGFSILDYGTTTAGLFIGGGIAYYLNRDVGLNAGFDLLDVAFSPSYIQFGWANIRVGANWFF